MTTLIIDKDTQEVTVTVTDASSTLEKTYHIDQSANIIIVKIEEVEDFSS